MNHIDPNTSAMNTAKVFPAFPPAPSVTEPEPPTGETPVWATDPAPTPETETEQVEPDLEPETSDVEPAAANTI